MAPDRRRRQSLMSNTPQPLLESIISGGMWPYLMGMKLTCRGHKALIAGGVKCHVFTSAALELRYGRKRALVGMTRALREKLLRKPLEVTVDRKPETKLMCAIFRDPLQDSDLHETVEGQTLREALHQAVGHLSQSETYGQPFKQRIRKIIDLRFGFEGGRSHTLEEIGKEFNRTGECIRRNEAKALRILSHPAHIGKLKPFIKKKAEALVDMAEED